MLAGVKIENPIQIFGEGSLGKEAPKETKSTTKERTTNAQIAKAAGVSDETIRKVEKIQKQAAPEIIEKVQSGEMSINEGYKHVKQAEKQQIRKPADFVLQKSAEQNPIDTRKEIAKAAGVSHDTIAKVEKIQKQAAPEIIEKVQSGEICPQKT